MSLKINFNGRIPVIGYVLVWGFILRMITIDQSFWLDEATSGLVVRNYSFAEIVMEFARGDFHPPLYYVVLKLWAELGGTGEVWLRGLSVMFGLGTIYLVYLIGKEVRDRSLGNLSALLLAVAPLHVYYSQEARMYSMGTALVSLSVYLFLRITEGKERRLEWVGFGLTLPLVFLTDYLLILILPVFWGLALVTGKKKGWWRKFMFWHLPLGVGVIAWWPIFEQQLLGGLGAKGTNWWGVLGSLSMKNLALIPIKFMIGRISFESRYLYALVVFGFGVLAIYLLRLTLRKTGKLVAIWVWLLGPTVMGVVVAFFVPVLSYFRFLFVLPAIYVLLAAGLLSVKEKWFFPVLLILLAGNAMFLGIYFGNERFHREDWRGLVEYVQAESVGNSGVVFVANSQMEGYRYYDSGRGLYYGDEGVEKGFDEIWLMRYVWDVFDPNDEVRQRVEEVGYEKRSEHNFNGVVVWRYENEDRN